MRIKCQIGKSHQPNSRRTQSIPASAANQNLTMSLTQPLLKNSPERL